MNSLVQRRISRRRSLSVLHNVEKSHSKGELSLDIGGALDELLVLNGQIAKKRRSSVKDQSLKKDVSSSQANILNITISSGRFNKMELTLNEPVKMSNCEENKKNNSSFTLSSEDVYDSLIDIEKALDEIEVPGLQRRSKRFCVIEKRNDNLSKNIKDNIIHTPAVRRSSRNSRKYLNCSNDEKSNIEASSKNKKRKLSVNNPSQGKLRDNHETITESVNLIKAKRKKTVGKQNTSVDTSNTIHIQNYYLDKTVPNSRTSLETIFEENLCFEKVMGKQKIERLIPFEEINKIKSRKSSECLKKMNSRKKKSVDLALANLQNRIDID